MPAIEIVEISVGQDEAGPCAYVQYSVLPNRLDSELESETPSIESDGSIKVMRCISRVSRSLAEADAAMIKDWVQSSKELTFKDLYDKVAIVRDHPLTDRRSCPSVYRAGSALWPYQEEPESPPPKKIKRQRRRRVFIDIGTQTDPASCPIPESPDTAEDSEETSDLAGTKRKLESLLGRRLMSEDREPKLIRTDPGAASLQRQPTLLLPPDQQVTPVQASGMIRRFSLGRQFSLLAPEHRLTLPPAANAKAAPPPLLDPKRAKEQVSRGLNNNVPVLTEAELQVLGVGNDPEHVRKYSQSAARVSEGPKDMLTVLDAVKAYKVELSVVRFKSPKALEEKLKCAQLDAMDEKDLEMLMTVYKVAITGDIQMKMLEEEKKHPGLEWRKVEQYLKILVPFPRQLLDAWKFALTHPASLEGIETSLRLINAAADAFLRCRDLHEITGYMIAIWNQMNGGSNVNLTFERVCEISQRKHLKTNCSVVHLAVNLWKQKRSLASSGEVAPSPKTPLPATPAAGNGVSGSNVKALVAKWQQVTPPVPSAPETPRSEPLRVVHGSPENLISKGESCVVATALQHLDAALAASSLSAVRAESQQLICLQAKLASSVAYFRESGPETWPIVEVLHQALEEPGQRIRALKGNVDEVEKSWARVLDSFGIRREQSTTEFFKCAKKLVLEVSSSLSM